MNEKLRVDLFESGLTMEEAGRLAMGRELIDSARRGDRAALLETAADYFAALSLIGDEPTYGLMDWDIVCGLLIDRGAEVKALLLRTLRHIDEDPPLDLPFAELDAEHLDTCEGTLQPQARLRLLTRDWTPLPEKALSRDIRSSGPHDMAVGIRSDANVLAAFAAADAGRARRALSHRERYGSAWPFDEERRFDLLAGALYAEAAKMGLLELPDRYAAFLGATSKNPSSGRQRRDSQAIRQTC